MSHAATNWAIQQRGLKPTTKIVLWHLCDRYNPDYGCFPSQEQLAHDCEISRSTLNEHLRALEMASLIRRVKRRTPGSKRQLPTRYILGFEIGFKPPNGGGEASCGNAQEPSLNSPETGNPEDLTPCPEMRHGDEGESVNDGGSLEPETASNPCPETAHGAVSDLDPDPCPDLRQSRVRNPDSNLVREPVRKPVKEEECARAREEDFEIFFEELLRALGMDPTSDLPGWWQGRPPREHVRRWRDELGLSEDRILDAARRSRDAHPAPPDGPKALDRAIERALRAGKTPSSHKGSQKSFTPSAPPPSASDVIAKYATWVNGGSFLPTSAITNTMRDRLIASGLVTRERLYERGIR